MLLQKKLEEDARAAQREAMRKLYEEEKIMVAAVILILYIWTYVVITSVYIWTLVVITSVLIRMPPGTC